MIGETPTFNIDGAHWLERWDAMMNAYNPHRRQCFSLVLTLARLSAASPARILDLGCGPGSLSLEAKRFYPQAEVTAIDFDPILLDIARKVACARGLDIIFLQQDIRDALWWETQDSRFDCIVSALALHWLSRESLRELYDRVFRALKPGGQFWNIDHMSCDNPHTQEAHRQQVRQRQEAAFADSGAERWSEFWKNLVHEASLGELELIRRAALFWEGSDDGQPPAFHVDALRQSGFARVKFPWQNLCDGVVRAQKACDPAAKECQIEEG